MTDVSSPIDYAVVGSHSAFMFKGFDLNRGQLVHPSNDAAASSELEHQGRILVAEDDPEVCRLFATILSSNGWEVETAENGLAALERVRARRFDAVLSDLSMPGMDGMQLLRAIRLNDPDVPVLFVTASPSLETAIQAVGSQAFRYLVKPVPVAALSAAVTEAVKSCRVARLQRESLQRAGYLTATQRLLLEKAFNEALENLWIAYQPIVRWSTRETYAYEALVRSRSALLPNPATLLDAAERLNRVPDLGRTIRAAIAASWTPSEDVRLFVNIHGAEILDAELFAADAPLSKLASGIVLEITERASLEHVTDLETRLVALRELGFQIAVDDLGAGYAGLTSVAVLRPDVLKLDMTLVRGIDRDEVKQRLVESLVAAGTKLGQRIIAEGVETEAERATLVALGCDLFQGFFFASPAEQLPSVLW